MATVLWWYDYCRGPTAGLALYQEQKVWFQKGDGDVFSLRQLSPENLALIEEEHERFREAVGYYRDHDPALYRPLSLTQTVVKFARQINPYRLAGEEIASISQEELDQYYPPRLIIPYQ